MKYKVGDEVRILMYDHQFNGLHGHIVAISGEYHIIKVTVDYNTKQYVEIECYCDELEMVVSFIDVKKNNFKEDLFYV